MTLLQMVLVVMFFPVIVIAACGFVYALFKTSAMAWLFLFSMCGSKWAEGKLRDTE